jgi:hypothetical protein
MRSEASYRFIAAQISSNRHHRGVLESEKAFENNFESD